MLALAGRSSSILRAAAGAAASFANAGPPRIPRLAIVRKVPDTFCDAITMEKPESTINLHKALQEHSNYVDLLRGLVDSVVELPADNAYPDCPFIEDTAVVIGSTALITRPGASSRRGEVDAVEEALAGLDFTVVRVEPPGTIDGGDVLRVEDTLYVGKSRRTNDEGIQAMARAFPELRVVPIDVFGTLHLKSVITWLGNNTFLVEDGPHTRAMFEQIRKASPAHGCDSLVVPHAGAANVLWVGDSLVYPSAYPCETSLYESFARQVMQSDISEFHKADGGLTCLSLIVA